jgi:regulator of protease activity HflC (stomatin/prohibitin superfamily)
MFSKLFDFLLSFWEVAVPFCVIDATSKGVKLRFGKFKGVLEPGLHWKIPFADRVIEQTVVVTTLTLPAQSLITKEKINIVTKGVVKYEIADVETYTLKVWDAKDAISDMTQAAIKRVVMEATWEECTTNDLDKTITEAARREATKWGIKVHRVTLTDIGTIRSYRLFNEPVSLT